MHASLTYKVNQSLFNSLDYWRTQLKGHPDSDFVNTILQFVGDGIPTLYKGPITNIISDSWPSARQHFSEVQTFINDNVAAGNITGPLSQPPDGFRASPLGAFQRKTSKKIRVIHDLSWPPGRSVNDHISSSECSLSYTSVDAAANLCLQFKEPWMVKIDLQSAFLTCPVVQGDRPLLGFIWPPGATGDCYYFFNVLPFGMKSSPRQFNFLACGLEYIMAKIGNTSCVLHYLDDYYCACASYKDAQRMLHIMVSTATSAGFSVQQQKTHGPSRVLEFLGVTIDTIKGQLRISPERLSEIQLLLRDWYHQKSCTKRELLSLIGKLSFCARVVRDGKKFLRRLISLSKKASNLHHRLGITAQARADIVWWQKCIEIHNGVAILDTRPLELNPVFSYTDASDMAAAAIYEQSWVILEFCGDNEWMRSMNIAWRELVAIVMCLAVFGARMQGRCLKMYTDNQAVLYCINTGSSKDDSLMALVRALYWYTTRYNVTYKAYYVASLDNGPSDSLSRLDMPRFRKLWPDSDVQMTPLCDFLLDF